MRTRVLNIFSLIFNVAIIAAAVLGLLPMFQAAADITSVFKNYSVLTAIVAVLAALVIIPFNLIAIFKCKTAMKSGISLFKLTAAAMSIVVIVVVLLVGLGVFDDPVEGFTYGREEGFYIGINSSFVDGPYLFLHLAVPVLTIISFIFFEVDVKASFADTLPSLGLSILYIGTFHLLFYVIYMEEDTNPSVWPYSFLAPIMDGNEGTGYDIPVQWATILIAAGSPVAVWLVSILLWGFNRLFNKAYGPVEEEKPAAEAVAIQPKPVEKKQEAPKTEQKVEPKVEEKPVEEAKPVIVEVQKAVLVESAPEQETKPDIKEETPVQESETVKEEAKPEVKEETPAVQKKKAPVSNKPRSASKKVNNKETPATRVYHISRHSGVGWKVKLAGGEKAIRVFPTQNEAIAYAKQLVNTQGGSIRIHSMDGSIRKG